MKKQLPTEAITHELAQSVFFQNRRGEPSHDPTTQRANARTGEQVTNSPPEQENQRTPEPAPERTPEQSPLPPPVKAITRLTAPPNGRTDKQELPEKTERYSFEIYPTQKECIEEFLYQHKRKTKEKISASKFIRAAIDYYFKALK